VKVCSNLYEGLLEYEEETTRVRPCLAEAYTVSEDGLTYTFTLREGVVFHDGTPCDAVAVVNSFQRQMQPDHPHNFGLPYVYWQSMFLQVVDSVSATDARTVRITLQSPHAPFLANLAMFNVYIVSPKALDEHGEQIALHPVGTGPFRFVHWHKDQEILLERFDDYWRETAKMAKLQFFSVKENSSRVLRMLGGDFDMMDGLSTDHYAKVQDSAAVQLVAKAGMNVAYLSLNHLHPPFDDVRVRRAVCHALRKDVIVANAYSGHAQVAVNPLPPTLWGYNDAIEDYPYNPERAQALLAEAGYAGEEVELYIMDNPRPYMPDPKRVAQFIQEDLRKVGLQVRIHPSIWDAHLKATQNGEHDMALLGWTGDNGDPDNFLYVLLDKDSAILGSANNISFYRSDRLHEVLVEAQQTMDQERRAELYRRAQVIIHEDVGFVPLVHTQQTVVLRNGVTGFKLHPTGTLRLRQVAIR
jgi:peptide/nickel transport system substrate-binding protein